MNAKPSNPQPTDPRRDARQPAWPETVERRIGLDLHGGVMSVVDSSEVSEESVDRLSPDGMLELPSPNKYVDIHASRLRRQLILGRGRLRRLTHAPRCLRYCDRSPQRERPI
ncbi:MAG: hypothetical protein H7Z14_02715 [Anaerolineae bacterium]|nr:hypothetical protein [Phycisphaerae bacterium]